MDAASGSNRVTLADFRALQAQLLQMKQHVYDSAERERRAVLLLQQYESSRSLGNISTGVGQGSNGLLCAAGLSPSGFYPTELNPFGPAAGGPSSEVFRLGVSVAVQTEPWMLTREEEQMLHISSAQALNTDLREQLGIAQAECVQLQQALAAKNVAAGSASFATLSSGCGVDGTLEEMAPSSSSSAPPIKAHAGDEHSSRALGNGTMRNSGSEPTYTAVRDAIIQERRAAIERSLRRRRHDWLLLLFHGWRAAHSNTRILRNMSSIALHLSKPSNGHTDVSAAARQIDQKKADAVALAALKAEDEARALREAEIRAMAQCVSTELKRCEGDVHAQALRKAELCSRLFGQLDDCQVRHAFELDVGEAVMGATLAELEGQLAGREAALAQLKSTMHSLVLDMHTKFLEAIEAPKSAET
eukprot:2543768-Pleurochrysis_carterae.AAC.1